MKFNQKKGLILISGIVGCVIFNEQSLPTLATPLTDTILSSYSNGNGSNQNTDNPLLTGSVVPPANNSQVAVNLSNTDNPVATLNLLNAPETNSNNGNSQPFTGSNSNGVKIAFNAPIASSSNGCTGSNTSANNPDGNKSTGDESVPEPTTIIGGILAASFGYYWKQKKIAGSH